MLLTLAEASVARRSQADPSPVGLIQGSFWVFPDPVGRCEHRRSHVWIAKPSEETCL